MTRIQKLLLLLAMVAISSTSWAQATPKSELEHCGVTGRTAWLDAYQRGEIAAVESNTTILLPLRLHIVGQTDGSGYADWDQLLAALELMNEDFATADVTFYIDGDIDFINNSAFYDHNGTQGSNMMLFNNDPGVINCYFVGNPNGACGYYNGGRDAIAIGNNCLGGADHTWGHELGHFLSLPHTFVGWEGYYNGDFSFADAPRDEPAPTFLGGRQVERADSSNCAIAADGFCDTPADYLSERWPCTGSGFYADSLMDPQGNKFRVYAYPIMGYANDACVESFTDEQRAAMVTNINFRGNLASNLPIETEPADEESMSLLFPDDGEQIQPVDVLEGVDLTWSPADNADFYIIDLATNQFYTGADQYIAYDTTFTLTPQDHDIEDGRRYFWRVRPVNRFVVDGDYGQEWDFRILDLVSSTMDPALDAAINVFPNPVGTGINSLSISANGLQDNAPLQLEMISTTGQILRNLNNLTPAGGTLQTELDLSGVANGIYFLRIRQQDRLLTRRIVVAK